jgi:hypothetical protein
MGVKRIQGLAREQRGIPQQAGEHAGDGGEKNGEQMRLCACMAGLLLIRARVRVISATWYSVLGIYRNANKEKDEDKKK